MHPHGASTISRAVVYLSVLCACLLMCAGCVKDEGQTVIVFAASSMASAFEEIESACQQARPDINVQMVFAGSQTLAMQINEGAPADLFISANLSQMQRVAGFTEPVAFADNELVAVAGPGARWSTVREAVEGASRIVIAHDGVPAGQYTKQALGELELWDAAEPKVVSYEHSVRSVLTKVLLGEVDLGFVYRTDAMAAANKVTLILFPAENPVPTQVWIALRAEPGVEDSPVAFVDRFLRSSPESHSILTRYGFTLPEGYP
jgi:molybdate transport system substrate-binding protein